MTVKTRSVLLYITTNISYNTFEDYSTTLSLKNDTQFIMFSLGTQNYTKHILFNALSHSFYFIFFLNARSLSFFIYAEIFRIFFRKAFIMAAIIKTKLE